MLIHIFFKNRVLFVSRLQLQIPFVGCQYLISFSVCTCVLRPALRLRDTSEMIKDYKDSLYISHFMPLLRAIRDIL